MIAYVEGEIVFLEGNAVVIKAGGVGYEIFVPLASLANLEPGQNVNFYVSTVVKEDAITLYGFPLPEHRRVFDMLRGVSGVGPKTALAVLSAMDAVELVGLVADASWQPLTRVSGVGRKTAQRIVLDLKERFQALVLEMPAATARSADPVFVELRAALSALGYRDREIAKVINGLQQETSERPELTVMLKRAIQEISKG